MKSDGIYPRHRRNATGRRMSVVFLSLVFMAAFVVGAHGEPWVYAVTQSGTIDVFDVRSDSSSTRSFDHVVTIRIDSSDVLDVVPTPGGKFVFAPLENGNVAIIDTEGHTHVRTITGETIPGEASGVPMRSMLEFSPYGNQLFLRRKTNGTIVRYDHAKSNLSNATRFTERGGISTAAMNRRGTRLYVHDDEGLKVLLASDGSSINTIDTGISASFVETGPNYRHIVAAGGGSAVVVDERRGRVIERITGGVNEVAPAFSERGDDLFLAMGKSLLRRSGRRFGKEDSLELDATVTGLAAGDDGIVSVSADQTIYLIDGEHLEITDEVTIDSPIRTLALVYQRPGEGFACF